MHNCRRQKVLSWLYFGLLIAGTNPLVVNSSIIGDTTILPAQDELLNSAAKDTLRRTCTYDVDVIRDLEITTPEYIAKQGYPAEVHRTVSKDGYVTELHRIPNPNQPPIVLFHGMLMTTREWFLNCEGRSLPLKLVNAGYDVWLANARGNKYSNSHIVYNTTDPQYWKYSVDEIITYDAPAIIDYILNVTGEEKVNWIGWSLGSAVIIGLLSSQPEYNEKLDVVFTFGVVAYVGHTRSIALKIISYLNRALDATFTWLNNGKLLPDLIIRLYYKVVPIICWPEAKFNFRGVCSQAMRIIDGYNPTQLNLAYFPLIFSSFPSSGSVKMFNHWFQWIRYDRFAKYDYGILENLRRYRTIRPPEYPLNQVRAKFVNLWADNDYISVPRDVDKTVRSLPNVIQNIRINMTTWNHLDFGMAKDADLYVYEPIISILNSYRRKKRSSTLNYS